MLGEFSTVDESMATDDLCKKIHEDKQDSRDSLQYTKRDEFTSELYKIEVRGLSKFFPPGPFKKLLSETMQLQVKKIKPCGPGKEHCYVTFSDEVSAQKAMVLLEGFKWKGRTLSTCKASPAPDPLLKVIEQKEDGTFKCANEEMDKLPIEERVALSVTPYASMPYKEQLEKKEEAARGILKKIGREIAKVNPELEELVRWQKLRRKGAVCEMDPIIPSPIEDGYRNKCEFTIGINSDTDEPTVGFRVASYKKGNVSVGPVLHLKHISDTMKNVVKSFESYVRASGHAAFSPVSHEGVWRQLTVRTSNSGDCLLIVTVHPQKLGESELVELKQNLVQYCETEGAQVGVTGLYCIVVGQKESGVTDEYEHLWGKTHITENVLGKMFRISPQAFFQVNTPAAEKLYEAVAELSEVDQTNVLLDVCCGTGTIGQCLAERTYKMYGLEIVEKAVEDAEYNARVNEIANVDYLLGNCEQTLPTIYSSCKGLEVKAVVDPPRAGLPASVIASLRKHQEVSSVVYMACDPVKCHQNFQSFARPVSKSLKGQFFFPIRAVAVDLFPHTDKYELVIVWERYDETKWRRIMEGNPRPKDEAYFSRVPELPSQEQYFQELADKKKAKSSAKIEEIPPRQWEPALRSGRKDQVSFSGSAYDTPAISSSDTEDLRHSLNNQSKDNFSRTGREGMGLSQRTSRGNTSGYGGHFSGRGGGFQDTWSSGPGPYRGEGEFLGDGNRDNGSLGYSDDSRPGMSYDDNSTFCVGDTQFTGEGYGFGIGRKDLTHCSIPAPRENFRDMNCDMSISRRLDLAENNDRGSYGAARGRRVFNCPYPYGGQLGPRGGSTRTSGKSSYGGVDPYSAAVARYNSEFEAAHMSEERTMAFSPPQRGGSFSSHRGKMALYSRATGGPCVSGRGGGDAYAGGTKGGFGGDQFGGHRTSWDDNYRNSGNRGIRGSVGGCEGRYGDRNNTGRGYGDSNGTTRGYDDRNNTSRGYGSGGYNVRGRGRGCNTMY